MCEQRSTEQGLIQAGEEAIYQVAEAVSGIVDNKNKAMNGLSRAVIVAAQQEDASEINQLIGALSGHDVGTVQEFLLVLKSNIEELGRVKSKNKSGGDCD